MKFLVSCYRPATSAPPRRQEEGEEDAAVHVVAPSRQHQRAKRTNKSGSAAHSGWRPSLQAIGENEGSVSDLKGKNSNERKPNKPRDRSYTSNSRSSRVAHGHRHGHHDDEYDRYSRINNSPMMMPPFSPAPFMF